MTTFVHAREQRIRQECCRLRADGHSCRSSTAHGGSRDSRGSRLAASETTTDAVASVRRKAASIPRRLGWTHICRQVGPYGTRSGYAGVMPSDDVRSHAEQARHNVTTAERLIVQAQELLDRADLLLAAAEPVLAPLSDTGGGTSPARPSSSTISGAGPDESRGDNDEAVQPGRHSRRGPPRLWQVMPSVRQPPT